MSAHFKPHQFYLLPLLGGTAWFLTLAILLIYWLAVGRPTYPSQINPSVAFISDIGAHHLKPLFITGGTITALAYAGTIFTAHYVRYDWRMYGIQDTTLKRVLSIIALVAGVATSVACICMTIFDTRRYPNIHGPLLNTTFVGIAISACCTEVVYARQMKRSTEFKDLRKYLAIVLCEIILTIAFFASLWTNHPRVSGTMEWTVSFVGAFYIWAFVGFVRVPNRSPDEAPERQPLLGSSE